MNEQVFHTDDLAKLWAIHHPNTLYMTLARYVAQGLLYRPQKGLYSLKNPVDLNPYLLGVKACHGPAYISCETVLFENGVINQPPTFISIVSQHSRKFTLVGQAFHSRQLSDAFLFNDAGIVLQAGVRIASVSRAVADLLYFNPKKYFDVPTAVNWDDVKALVSVIGYPTTIIKHYVDTK